MHAIPMTAPEYINVGQLPAIRIQNDDGAQAVITLFGAHLVSWIPAGGQEQLFCSTRSVLDGSKAIRGGIPLIFPQFSERGSGMRHGFARMSTWRLVRSGKENAAAFAEFALGSNDRLAQPWPHAFSLLFRVAVQGDTLALSLRVHNTGSSDMPFSAAFHTYFAVDDIAATQVEGLHQARYSDQTLPGGPESVQEEHLLTCKEALDRIYFASPSQLRLRDSRKELALAQEGFTDAVVWNPGPAAGINDLAEDDYRRFICIEPACIEPVRLPAGAEWVGTHRVRCRA